MAATHLTGPGNYAQLSRAVRTRQARSAYAGLPNGSVSRVPDRDLRGLLIGYAVSSAGSGVGAGALPIVALLVLHSSAFQVSLLAGLSGLVAAAVMLPLGAGIEHRLKRPVMIAADLTRFAALASVPAAALGQVLTYPQLVVVGIVSTAATIAFNAASGANLKHLAEGASRMRANSWMQSTDWISQSAGPPVGGLLISAVGATATMAVDALSYLGSVIGVLRIAKREPPPQPSAHSGIMAGWRYIFAHRDLRGLFLNAMVFGGPVIMATPLLAVLILDRLGLPARDYGISLGVPCLGGIAGSWLSPRLVTRFGQRRVLLVAGTLRAPWMLLYPLARHGLPGLGIIMTADTLMLVCAGVFGPVFATYQMNVTADAYMARARTAWGISAKTVQPLCVLAGGGLAALAGVRMALLIGGLACTASVLLMPYRSIARDPKQPEISAAGLAGQSPALAP